MIWPSITVDSMRKRQTKKNKTPIFPTDLSTTKTPHWIGPPNIEKQHLAWRFSKADLSGPYHCREFSLADFQQLWDRLRAFEGMNYGALRNAGSLHEIPVIRMTHEAKERLKELELDDIDNMFSFHIDGSCRMWCIKHQNIFSVLWWDRNHGAYIVKKKHT